MYALPEGEILDLRAVLLCHVDVSKTSLVSACLGDQLITPQK
jgi:hypothetical protein